MSMIMEFKEFATKGNTIEKKRKRPLLQKAQAWR